MYMDFQVGWGYFERPSRIWPPKWVRSLKLPFERLIFRLQLTYRSCVLVQVMPFERYSSWSDSTNNLTYQKSRSFSRYPLVTIHGVIDLVHTSFTLVFRHGKLSRRCRNFAWNTLKSKFAYFVLRKILLNITHFHIFSTQHDAW